MNLLPDWAPNIHPLLVHFPIALLCTAAAADVVGWAFHRNRPLRQFATLLYVLGTGAAAAAYVTGRAASQTIWLPGMAQAVLGEHWNWALRTVWFFAIVTVVRLVAPAPIAARRRAPRSSRRWFWWDSWGLVCSSKPAIAAAGSSINMVSARPE